MLSASRAISSATSLVLSARGAALRVAIRAASAFFSDSDIPPATSWMNAFSSAVRTFPALLGARVSQHSRTFFSPVSSLETVTK